MNKYPKDGLGRLVGFLFLILIPLTTLVPITPVPAWLTQDLLSRWASALVFLLCLAAYLIHSKAQPVLRLDFPDLLVLLLLAWVMLSVWNSRETFDSFYAFKSFLAMVLWWFSLRLFWRRWPGLYPAFEKIFFWTAVLASGWLIFTTAGRWVWFSFFERFVPRQGFFPNPNIAAGFLGVALVWLALKKMHQTFFSSWGFGLIFIAWCLTQSRGAFLSMLLVMIVYLLLNVKNVESRLAQWTRRQWIQSGILVLVVAAILSPMVDRLFHVLETDPYAYNRLDLWASVLKMAVAQPLMGFGPGTFQDVYPVFRPSSLWNALVAASHDEYLQVAVECGLPALVLTLLLLWTLLWETGSRLLKAPAFKNVSGDLAGAECAFYLILLEGTHNLVDFTFHEWSHRLVLFSFATFALVDKKAQDDVKATFQFSTRAFFGGAALVVLFIAWVLGVGSAKDYMARVKDFSGIFFYQQGDLNTAEAFAQRSLSYRDNFMDPWNSLGVIEDARAVMAKSAKEREKHFQAADEYFRKAIELSPYSLEPRENEVQDLIKRGRVSQALDLQTQLVEKAPELPTSYYNLGLLQMQVGHFNDAVLSTQKAIELVPYYLAAYYLKAKALEAMGKKEDALNVYQELKNRGAADPSGQIEANLQRLKKQR